MRRPFLAEKIFEDQTGACCSQGNRVFVPISPNPRISRRILCSKGRLFFHGTLDRLSARNRNSSWDRCARRGNASGVIGSARAGGGVAVLPSQLAWIASLAATSSNRDPLCRREDPFQRKSSRRSAVAVANPLGFLRPIVPGEEGPPAWPYRAARTPGSPRRRSESKWRLLGQASFRGVEGICRLRASSSSITRRWDLRRVTGMRRSEARR